jgi:hypothetical protein
MKERSLSSSNIHLRDTAKASQQLTTNVASSTAVETGQPVATVISRVKTLKTSKPALLQKKPAS